MCDDLRQMFQSARAKDAAKSLELTYKQDPRVFKLTRDYLDHDTSVLLLPGRDGEVSIKTFQRHTFPLKGRWRYIEPCVEAVRCPLCEYEALHDETLGRTDRQFATNILIIDDPVRPENNNRVFIFEFGVQIARKIEAVLKTRDLYDGRTSLWLNVSGQGAAMDYRGSEFCFEDDADPVDLRALTKRHVPHSLIDYPSVRSYDHLVVSLNRALEAVKMPVLEPVAS